MQDAVYCRVQRGAIWWVQSSGRTVQDAGRMQHQGAVCRVQDTSCRLQGAARFGVQGPEWRVRSAGAEVEGAECRMEGGGCRVQDAALAYSGCRVQDAEKSAGSFLGIPRCIDSLQIRAGWMPCTGCISIPRQSINIYLPETNIISLRNCC